MPLIDWDDQLINTDKIVTIRTTNDCILIDCGDPSGEPLRFQYQSDAEVQQAFAELKDILEHVGAYIPPDKIPPRNASRYGGGGRQP